MEMIRLFIALAISLLLSACDNNNSNAQTKANANDNKHESAKFDCSNGNVTTECDITAGDQLGSGKWRHAKLNLSGSDASLNIDGEMFAKTDVKSDFIDGSRVTDFELKSAKGSRAEINIERSNNGSRMRVNAWNADGKLMLTSNR